MHATLLVLATAIGVWLLLTVGFHCLLARTGIAAVLRGRHASAIALTFDDGPEPVRTRRILDILEAHGARGTFFVIAERVAAHPELLGELVERGHEVQLHGLRHRHTWATLPWRHAAQWREAFRILDEAAGVRPTAWRPPWGIGSLPAWLAARSLRMRTVLWSVCPEGFFRPRPPEALAARTLRRIRGGDIVCLHDSGGFADTPERVAASLQILLPALAERGLEARTLSEVLAGNGGERRPVEGCPSTPPGAIADGAEARGPADNRLG